LTKNDPRAGEAPTHPIVPDHPAEAFAGTAEAYARFRVPYPQLLIDHLRTRAGITGEGRLLDLACGTGQVALALAPHFSEVWALDREAEMLEVGRREAAARGFENVVWKEGDRKSVV
jgi:ubiquinone/menaquinone biosynthesis C-methylase UbiE